MWKIYIAKGSFLITVLEEGQTWLDEGKDDVRSSLESKQASGLSNEDDIRDLILVNHPV